MKIADAQMQPLKANIQENVALHKHLTKLAALHRVELIAFPELSLTRYEPTIAGLNDVEQGLVIYAPAMPQIPPKTIRWMPQS